jgi:hypothetical protein
MTALSNVRKGDPGPRGTYLFSAERAAKTNVVLWNGALAGIDSTTGYLVPFSAATTLIRPCVVDTNGYGDKIDMTGIASGAGIGAAVKVWFGVFRFNNSSAGDAIAQANVGATVYGVDDQTVALTNGSGTRSAVGVVEAVDTSGVWVRLQF